MSTVASRVIRLKIDLTKKTSDRFQDVNTGATPELWKGNDVDFQIGIFLANSIITDISSVATLTLSVRHTNASGAMLMTKTLSAVDLTNCLAAAWTDGTGKHASVLFTGQAANIAVGSHWLVVDVTTTHSPGRSVTLGATTFLVVDDGAGSEAAAEAVDGLAYTKAEADGRHVQKHEDLAFTQWRNGTWYHYIASTDLWYPEVAAIVDGVAVLTLGPGETL